MNTKPFYTSKTLWLNVIGLVVFAVQAKTTFLIGPEYQASILAVINLILRGVTGKPVDWEMPDKIRNINLGLLLLLIVPATLLLNGCAGLSKAIDEHELVTELAVRAATARVLEEHPGWVDDTYRITLEAKLFLAGDGVTTLEDLQQYVVTQIDWGGLMPEEEALLATLITAVRQQIEKSLVDRGVTEPGAAVVRAAKVLSWINQTAKVRL